MTRAKILIVEDEIIVGLDLQKTLVRMGYSAPLIAISGKMALKYAAKLNPDLVLMDIVLKGELDGIQVAEQLDAEYGMPVVYLTAHSDRYTFARARMTRPSGYLLKPFDEKKLGETIEAALAFYQREKNRSQSGEGGPKPASILVVDSTNLTQVVVTNLLADRGHRVKLAGRAIQAIKMLKEGDFDLILMDLNLPDIKGEVFIRGLRREMGLKTPIIVLAAEITADTVVFLKGQNIAGFVRKSADYEFRLLEEVDRILNPSRGEPTAEEGGKEGDRTEGPAPTAGGEVGEGGEEEDDWVKDL